MKQVKIFTAANSTTAENRINTFCKTNNVIDIKMAGDGHTTCITYMIIYTTE